MSFPYHYVENYSTPTTPHASSPWEVDQNPAEMFIQEQVPQQQPYEPPTVIQLQEHTSLPEPEQVVPSQQHHELPSSAHRLYPIHEARSEGDGGEYKPQSPLVDTCPIGTSGSSSSSAMPVRHASTRPRLQLAPHPYRRPQSATGGSAVRTPRERQHVRFASSGGRSSAGGSSRVPSSGPSASSPVSSPHQNTGATSTVSSTAPNNRPFESEQQPRRFIIRADVHYDADSKVITAILELPGVKKTDLCIKLSTCWYNRVKQVIVMGKSSPLFSDESGFAVRERKHGEFTRTFAVPPDTRIEDVHANMQDGLLLLRIACHMPAEVEDAQDIQIH